MSSFTSSLLVEVLPAARNGAGLFRLLEPFSYDVGALGSGQRIEVPANFETDLCTIPRLARPFLMQSGPAAKAAVLHDWLLSTNDPRASDVFSEALRVAGVAGFTHWLLVAAVRVWTP